MLDALQDMTLRYLMPEPYTDRLGITYRTGAEIQLAFIRDVVWLVDTLAPDEDIG